MLLPPPKFGEHVANNINTYSKMTTARSKNCTLFGGSCSSVERAPGLSNGSKPSFSPFCSPNTIGEEKRPCVSVSFPHWQDVMAPPLQLRPWPHDSSAAADGNIAPSFAG